MWGAASGLEESGTLFGRSGSKIMSQLDSFLLPIRLALRQKTRLLFDRHRLLREDRIVVLMLQALLVVGFAATLAVGLSGLGQRERLLDDTFLALGATAVLLSVIPVVELFPRLSERLAPHWPLSGPQRALSDLVFATFGLWSAMFLAACLTAGALASPSRFLPVLAAGLGAILGLVAMALLIRYLFDLFVRSWIARLTLGVALAACLAPRVGFLSLAAVRSGYFLPSQAVAGLFRPELTSSGATNLVLGAWLAALVWTGLYLVVAGKGYWKWSEVFTFASRRGRSANVVALVEELPLVRGVREPARAIFAHHLCYLVRSSRFWFQALYLPIATPFLITKFATTPSVKVFLFVLCLQAGNSMFLYNLFAFDGTGTWLWTYGPVPPRVLVAAKNAAVFAASVPSLLVALIAVGVGVKNGAAFVAPAGLLYFAFLLFNAAAGNLVSVSYPLAIDLKNLWRTFLAPPALPLVLLSVGCTGTAFGVVWWLLRDHPVVLGVTQLALTTGAAITYRALLGKAGDATREKSADLALKMAEAQ